MLTLFVLIDDDGIIRSALRDQGFIVTVADSVVGAWKLINSPAVRRATDRSTYAGGGRRLQHCSQPPTMYIMESGEKRRSVSGK
jgi:hypothetical protein